MGEQAAITVRVEREIKEEAVKVFKSVGLNLNAGVEVYLRAVVREQRIPFELAVNRQEPSDTEVE